MTGKDNDKKSSRHKKGGSSSKSSHKKSSSSSDPKKSSSHRNSSSRTTRDARPDTTQGDYEQEDDGPQYSEGDEEDYTEAPYARGEDAAAATQRPSATTGYYASYNQIQQSATGSTDPQSGASYEDTQYSAELTRSNLSQIHSTRQNPQPSESASRRVEPTAYQTASWGPPQLQQSYYFPTSYAPSTGTQQPSGRSGVTGQSYSSTPVDDIQRTLEGTSLEGPTVPRSASAAATGRPPYYSSTTTYSPSSYAQGSAAAIARPQYYSSTTPYSPPSSYAQASAASAASGPDSGQTADTRMRPWQEMQENLQHRPAESWDTAPNDQRTMDDGVNRVRPEDDNTGS
jgi:hypothetical protein